MKVLKNNYNEFNSTDKDIKQVNIYPRKLICESCGSELEYEELDMRMGTYGCMYVDCPLCGYDNMLDDNEKNITLTTDNIEFPIHFWHTSKETCGVDCCDNNGVKKYIYKAINYFRENKDEYNYTCETGNLYIHVHRLSNDGFYEVIVSNDFYTTEIPFEAKDY